MKNVEDDLLCLSRRTHSVDGIFKTIYNDEKYEKDLPSDYK
jgi:hypothetical protein